MRLRVCRLPTFLSIALAFCCVIQTLILLFWSESKSSLALEQTLELSRATTLTRIGSRIQRPLLPDLQSCSPSLEERGPKRIPGYIEGCNSTYYGYVMRDLAARVLSRTISQSTVLVVAAGAETALSLVQSQKDGWHEEGLRKQFNYAVGQSFVLSAAKQGHQVYALNGEAPSVNSWWNSFSSRAHDRPNWVLLTVFDPDVGQEDAVIEASSSFIQDATATYIVFRGSAQGIIHRGLKAAEQFLALGYKLQVLSSSHTTKQGETTFGPNTILTNRSIITSFFRYGSDLAMEADGEKGVFRAYLFATQGLDLAIPSRREYVNLTKGQHVVTKGQHVDQGIPYKDCPTSTAKVEFQANSLFKVSCFGKETMITAQNQKYGKSVWHSRSSLASSETACIRCDESFMLNTHRSTGDHKSDVACATRILEKPMAPLPNTGITQQEPHNMLFIMIDPISRARFDQSLPGTKELLSKMGFTEFENYTAVGDNSGPNQAALYTGSPLSDRDAISTHDKNGATWLWDELREAGFATFKAEDGCILNSNMVQSMKPNVTHGSDLHHMLCFDYARPNCLGSKPAAEHLTDYALQFILKYSERKPWAAFLSFIDGHEDTGMGAGTLDRPISKFLQDVRARVATREWDNLVVAVISDHGLHYGPFFQSFQGQQERAQPVLHMKVPIELNDMGLLLNRKKFTTPFDVHATLREATLGRFNTLASSPGLSLLKPLPLSRNSCFSTIDIPNRYCELFDSPDKKRALSLEMPSPPSILSFYADIPKTHKRQMEMRPSLPLSRRAEVNAGCYCATNTDRKWFGTDRSWSECESHPWGPLPDTSLEPNQHFMLVDCPNRPLHLETRIVPNQHVRKRSQRAFPSQDLNVLPNILFLEIDSVSVTYADRHFRRSREVLNKYRIKRSKEGYECLSGICSADFSAGVSIAGPNSITNQVAALSGCVSSPSGDTCGMGESDVGGICNETNAFQYGLRMTKYHDQFKTSYWCQPETDGTQGTSPWLFDVTGKNGHVIYFAEEFCFEGSPFVTQDNIFPLRYADVKPHKVFCRLVENRFRKANLSILPHRRWAKEKLGEPCTEGFEGDEKARIALDHVEHMWNAYSDQPKLAFLNVMAAHDYDPDWSKVALKAERYDELLSSFLESMLAREDAKNTIIIVRSDHGLQSGPLTMDYSTQVEHTRPWTEMLVPESLPGLSKEALFQNQNRLSSGFDLYRTLRALTTATTTGVTEPAAFSPVVPDWSFNLLATPIPKSRSCRDARLSSDSCREESIPLGFGVCNKFDLRQAKFCADYQTTAE